LAGTDSGHDFEAGPFPSRRPADQKSGPKGPVAAAAGYGEIVCVPEIDCRIGLGSDRELRTPFSDRRIELLKLRIAPITYAVKTDRCCIGVRRSSIESRFLPGASRGKNDQQDRCQSYEQTNILH